MADPFAAYPAAPAGTPGLPPPPVATPSDPFAAYPLAPQQAAPEPRAASGVAESLQAGFQASAPGLAWRGRLPDLVINPEHSAWWERALSGVAQIGMELPLMIGGAMVGAPAGAAVGTAVAPGPGTAAGSLLGAGAGMGIVPAAIRESLIQAYKSGEIKTAGEFWNAVREVATTAAKEGAINAVGMGLGGVAARTAGKALVPAIGQSISVPTATAAIAGADITAQIATMATMPAALQGRLPDLQEILDAAILVGGLSLAGVTASKITNTYMRTGKTPAEQVADAQRDPEIARDLTTPPAAPPVPDYVPPRLEPMLKIQENLFTETARLGEMEARAATTPLTDMERIEFNTLKAKVLDLENQLKTGAPELARAATYTADQFVEARSMADQRLVELTEKAGTDRLTDTERAERVFLTNSLDKPDSLARHFGFEPQILVRPSPEQMDTSAQKIYDDVLRMAKDADEARRTAGNEPLGDDHAQAIAALVRARIRTRAERLGVLPETLYNERPVKIADETAVLEAVAKGEEPTPPAPPAGPAVEVDLFGDPIQTATDAPAERMEIANLATQEVPLANLILSKEVPQFKNAANREGVVVPLGGMFDRTGVGPIQVWERLDGTLEVISGRHRLDLAKRSGEETIPAQIHREADGFTARMAATLDAQLNIREEQGSVADYAQYFKDAEIGKDAADKLGLLARAKGRAGFAIARDASPDLLASHRAGRLTDEAALSISSTAPGSARLQALGIAAVQDGKSILYATNLMRSVDLMAAERMAAGQQGDIFGFDDSALREASAMAKKAASKQRAISEQISAVSGASKRPEIARKMGVNVEDPAAVQAKIIELKNEQYLWDNWPLYPELVAKLRGETLKQAAKTEDLEYQRDQVLKYAEELGYVIDSGFGSGLSKSQYLVLWENAKLDENGAIQAGNQLKIRFSDHDLPPTYKRVHGEADYEVSPSSRMDQMGGNWRDAIKWLATRAGKEPPPIVRAIEKRQEIAATKSLIRNAEADVRIKTSALNTYNAAVEAEKITASKSRSSKNWMLRGEGLPGGIGFYGLGRMDGEAFTVERAIDLGRDRITSELNGAQARLEKIKAEQDTLYQDEFPMLPETPAEAAARDRDAAQAAMRKIEKTRKTTESLAKFWSARTWKTEAEARAMMRDRIIQDNEHYPMFTAIDPAVVDQIQFVRAKGGQVKTKIPATPKKQVAWSEERPDRGEGSSPEVDWYGRDNQDKGTPESIREGFARGEVKIYQAWIPVDELPPARGDDIKNGALTPESGARNDLSFRGDPPPLKISVGKGGKVQIEDGNHRLAWWREQGHDYVPAWVLDGRPESKLPNNVLYQSSVRDTWYRSALGEAVNTANIKAAPAKGWQDFFKGQVAKGGIKADEIKWSGVEEWLQLQEGRVTKEQVADYLANNGVKVEEVMLGDKANPKAITAAYQWINDHLTGDDRLEAIGAMEAAKNGHEESIGDLQRLGAPDEIVQPFYNNVSDGATKFGQYQLPGGENYREIALVLPPKPDTATLPPGYDVKKLARPTVRGAHWAVIEPGGAGNTLSYLTGADVTREMAVAEAIRDLRRAGIMPKAPADSTFQAPPAHSMGDAADTNRLAHIRFNERTDAEGKKVLFIEEFQSDWAQKGKKEGFKSDSPKFTVEPDPVTQGTDHALWLVKDDAGNTVNFGATKQEAQRWADAYAEEKMNTSGKVPAAPFVAKREFAVFKDGQEFTRKDKNGKDFTERYDTQERAAEAAKKAGGEVRDLGYGEDTTAWVGLTLKRMIAYAAQNGFDRIAWTRGEQQVERYTSALRKAVDVIEWTKTDKGVQLVGYKFGEGRSLLQTYGDADLREQANQALRDNDYLGFDSAAAARNALLNSPTDWTSRWEVDEFAQSDIQAWLDSTKEKESSRPRKKVVDTTEKDDALSDAIGKAMAQKIISDPNQSGTIEGEGIRIDSTGMAGFYDRIVPKVANEVLKKLGGGKVADVKIDAAEAIGDIGEGSLAVVRPNGEVIAFTDYDSQAHEIAREHAGARVVSASEVKDAAENASAQQGFDITQSMKDKATEGLPLFQQRDQMHRGSYDIAENLITIMGKADKSTVVHELGHSWLEEMKTDAARPDAVDQIKADWDILRRELAIGEDGDISRASHEQFARSVERYLADGDAPSVELRGVFERFKQWLLDIYKDLRNLNVEINPELRSVLDRMLATDEEIRAAREMNVPRAYVPEAMAIKAAEIVPPPAARRKIEPGFKAEQASMEPFADELPPGPGEAPDNIHVNYAYINSPDDVKLAMQRMAEIDQANIQAQRGGTDGVKSWAEANAEQARYLNDILGGSEDTLHLFEPRDPNAPHVDARLGILKKLAVGAAKDSARLRDVVLEAGHDATVRQQLEYMGSIERARMIQAEFLGERAAVARALNALKDTTEGTGEIARMLEVIGLGDTDGTLFQAARTPAEEQAYLKAKLDEILQNYRGKTVLDIAKLHKEIGTLKGTFKFTEEVSKATKWEMVVEGWKSGLLSGPVTHTTNLFGTGAFMTMRAPVDFLSAMIGMARGASPGLGESDRASMSEAIARITGMVGGAQDGLKLAAATFRMDDPTGKTEAYRTAIPGRAGEIIRIPLRLMGAEDALVSTMYQRGELRALAIRQAFDENMNPGTREFSERVQQLVDNPTEDMTVAAETAATRMTFNAPLGEKGVALQLFVAKWNLQWMIPFIRTPINIAKELARMSPLAPVVGEWRADYAKGGVARDRAIAEVALGTAVMGLTMAYAFAGNISGSSGPDPGKNRGKAGVWQPNSILIGDTWYEYGRIQPTGTLMVLAADIAAVWDHMTDEEKDKIPKMMAIAFSNAVTNQTFLQGITNFLNAMSDPTRFAPKFLQGLAGSMVPNIIAQPTAMADPVVREVNGMLEAVQARLPGFRQNLLPSRDWLGEPRAARERLGVILPSRTLDVTKDKVRLEAARLDLSMAAPPRKTHIGKGTGKLGDVELTPEEIDTFEKVGGEFAHQILDNIVNSQGYDKIPDIVKQQIFRKVITAGRRIGAVAALPPEKRMAYLQSITEKVVQELQPGETQ